MTQVSEPFPLFYDTDGTPLDNGMIYVGTANLDPVTNPVQLYSDENLTVPIAQPVRTLAGRPAYQGSPVRLYAAEVAVSVAVFDKDRVPVTSDPALDGLSARDVAFLQSGTGAVTRTVQAKLRDFPSVQDYDTLANARTAAGVKPLLDTASGKIWHFGVSAPVFDEAATVLGRGIAFDSKGATVTIPAGKQWNFIGIRNAGSEIDCNIGSGGIVVGLSYYLRSVAGSHSTSNMYAALGFIANAGPGTVKGLYGRGIAESGCTGTVMGGIFRAEVKTGSTSTAHALQIGHAGATGIALNSMILMDTEEATGSAQYGLLSAANISYSTAFIRGVANGAGLAFQWQASGGGQNLFAVDAAGKATFSLLTANALAVDLQNGGRINFTATTATGTAGAATLPANPVEFIRVTVNGNQRVIPVYNP